MEETSPPDNSRRRWIRGGGLVAAGLIAGGILAGTLAAHAQPSVSTATGTASSGARAGGSETPLTGTTAQKVRAAALAAVPGGTILRVETDSDGSPYEAHVRKADGTEVTVKIDKSFKVTSIRAGCSHGAGATASA